MRIFNRFKINFYKLKMIKLSVMKSNNICISKEEECKKVQATCFIKMLLRISCQSKVRATLMLSWKMFILLLDKIFILISHHPWEEWLIFSFMKLSIQLFTKQNQSRFHPNKLRKSTMEESIQRDLKKIWQKCTFVWWSIKQVKKLLRMVL